MQKYNFQKKKKSSKRNQNLSRYHNSTTNLKFPHKPKYHLSDILIEKQTYLLPLGPKSLKLLYSIMNPNTISLPSWQARPTKKKTRRKRKEKDTTFLLSQKTIVRFFCQIVPRIPHLPSKGSFIFQNYISYLIIFILKNGPQKIP